jgi:hypothetical protein
MGLCIPDAFALGVTLTMITNRSSSRFARAAGRASLLAGFLVTPVAMAGPHEPPPQGSHHLQTPAHRFGAAVKSAGQRVASFFGKGKVPTASHESASVDAHRVAARTAIWSALVGPKEPATMYGAYAKPKASSEVARFNGALANRDRAVEHARRGDHLAAYTSHADSARALFEMGAHQDAGHAKLAAAAELMLFLVNEPGGSSYLVRDIPRLYEEAALSFKAAGATEDAISSFGAMAAAHAKDFAGGHAQQSTEALRDAKSHQAEAIGYIAKAYDGASQFEQAATKYIEAATLSNEIGSTEAHKHANAGLTAFTKAAEAKAREHNPREAAALYGRAVNEPYRMLLSSMPGHTSINAHYEAAAELRMKQSEQLVLAHDNTAAAGALLEAAGLFARVQPFGKDGLHPYYASPNYEAASRATERAAFFFEAAGDHLGAAKAFEGTAKLHLGLSVENANKSRFESARSLQTETTRLAAAHAMRGSKQARLDAAQLLMRASKAFTKAGHTLDAARTVREANALSS